MLQYYQYQWALIYKSTENGTIIMGQAEGMAVFDFLKWTKHPVNSCCFRFVLFVFWFISHSNNSKHFSPSLNYITSTKNSLGLPIARWKDCLDAVSSGGTDPRSLVGGAPGGPPGVKVGGKDGRGGVGRVGKGLPMAGWGWGCCGTIMTIMGLYGIGIPGGYGARWWGGTLWWDRWLRLRLCSLGVVELWSRVRLLRTEYSDSLPLPEQESAPPPPTGDFSSRPLVLPPPLLPCLRSPSLRVEPLLRLPVRERNKQRKSCV